MNAMTALITEARFGANHGYALDGDLVHLNADIEVTGAGLACTLQLWAAAQPGNAADFNGAFPGSCIAQYQTYLGAGNHAIAVSLDALIPAGSGDHAIFLALTTVESDGQVRLLDLANYPRREHFLLPRLSGPVGYRLLDGRVALSAACIENPRPAGNSSENLVLELWALPDGQIYNGGYFSGYGLASANVGRLLGQFGLTQCEYLEPLTLPADGRYHLALMLREWTLDGYRTRDYVNFDLPVDFPLVSANAAPLIDQVDQPELADDLETEHSQSVAPVVAVEAPVAEAPVVEAAAAPAVEAPSAVEKVAKAKGKGKKAKAELALVSINSADAASLADVKGLSKTVAAAIVANRPYASVDDLLKVKGIGAKSLDKFRHLVTL